MAASPISRDQKIAKLLPSANGLMNDDLKSLAGKTESSVEELIDIISSMFARAFGLRYYKTLKANFPAHPEIRKAYRQKMRIVEVAINAPDTLQKRLDKSSFFSINNPKWWRNFAIKCMPHAQEETSQNLATILYKAISNEPYSPPPIDLVPLFNTTALMTPQNSWISWGSLVKAYHFKGGALIMKAEIILDFFPLRLALNNLNTDCPLKYRWERGVTTFREFVAKMTVQAMEAFFCCPLPEPIALDLAKTFSENEEVRKDITFFLTNTERKINYDDYQELYTRCRMIMNFVKGHLPSGRNRTEVLDWIFKSNQEYTHNIHRPKYPIEKSCDVDRLAPLVLNLQPIYDKNGESFDQTAFSLLLMLVHLPEPKEEFIDFLVMANDSPYAVISIKQILDYSHYDGQRDYRKEKERLKVINAHLPDGLPYSPEYFNLIAEKKYTLSIEEFAEKIQAFNAIFLERNGDLYFKALRRFLLGESDPSYLEVLNLPNDLEIFLKISPYIDPKRIPGILWVIKHFPEELNSNHIQSLILRPLSLLPKELSENYRVDTLRIIDELGYPFTLEDKLFLFYELMSLQGKDAQRFANLQFIQLVEAHLGYRLTPSTVATFLSYHPNFEVGEVEPIFKELDTISIPTQNLGIYQSQCSGFSLLEAVPYRRDRGDAEGAKDRDAGAGKTQVLSRNGYKSNERLRSIAELQQILVDRDRQRDYYRINEHIERPIGDIQGFLYSTVTFLETRSICSFIPKAVFGPVFSKEETYIRSEEIGEGNEMLIRFKSVRKVIQPPWILPSSLHQALLPLSFESDLNKGLYGSWEIQGERLIFRFTLVSFPDYCSYSGYAVLPISLTEIAEQPFIFSLIRKAFYHFIPNTSEGLPSLLNHEEFKAAWEDFDYFENGQTLSPRSKSRSLEEPLNSFISQLVPLLQKALTGLTTHQKYLGSNKSAQILLFQTYLETAGIGDTFPHENYHLIIPPSLINKRLLPYFGTQFEMSSLEGPSAAASSSGSSQQRLKIITQDHTPLDLPFSIEEEGTELSYDDSEYRELDDTKVSYERKGIRITLKTAWEETPIEVSVVYPEDIKQNLSWQIALLKSRLYEAMVKGQEVLETRSPTPSSSSVIAAGSL